MLEYREPLFRPPAEARSLILQVMYGCPDNCCRFCGMYKGKRYERRPSGELEAEVQALPAGVTEQVFKVFLADGDALVVGEQELKALLELLRRKFPRLRRVSAYATPGSILNLGARALTGLARAGLTLLYVGLESGHEPLLREAGKKNTVAEYVKACQLAQSAGIKLSVTAILGLGGRRYSEAHARDTAAAINASSPRFFSLLTLIPGGNFSWLRQLELQTRAELLLEARTMIAGLDLETIFRSDHGSNFVDLGGTLPKDRAAILARADALLAQADPCWLEEIPQFFGEMSY